MSIFDATLAYMALCKTGNDVIYFLLAPPLSSSCCFFLSSTFCSSLQVSPSGSLTPTWRRSRRYPPSSVASITRSSWRRRPRGTNTPAPPRPRATWSTGWTAPSSTWSETKCRGLCYLLAGWSTPRPWQCNTHTHTHAHTHTHTHTHTYTHTLLAGPRRDSGVCGGRYLWGYLI